MLACLLAFCACSGESASTSTDLPTTVSTGGSSPVSPSVTDLGDTFELPPVDDESADATLEALTGSNLGVWIDQARAVATAPDPPCDPASMMLTPEQFETTLSLADELTGELVSNLDASLGAAAEWCRQNDLDAAQSELDDAAATSAVLGQRLGELDR